MRLCQDGLWGHFESLPKENPPESLDSSGLSVQVWPFGREAAARRRHLLQDDLGQQTKAIDAALDWFEKSDDAGFSQISEVLRKRHCC